MSVLPLNLIKGTRSVVYERLENTEDIEEVEHQMEKIKAKCEDGRPLSSRDRRNLQEFEDKLQVLQRRGRHLEIAESHCCTKVGSALRPLKILLGIFFILVALLFVVALFISNLDKALHSAGISSGFMVFGTNLTNPLNELLLTLQPVFPLDYVLITVITMYFVFTSMAG
ncbi:lysosomal cobalamin transport escort protein LMBD1-like, partial [Oncorhynchus masou masou]|uniref:lysosomal cobalamin transport escort protein LMBD1-like n=1 Tax=Oncorhynchus masou masou TaxID=90313 RepID=UPI0031835A91